MHAPIKKIVSRRAGAAFAAQLETMLSKPQRTNANVAAVNVMQRSSLRPTGAKDRRLQNAGSASMASPY
jgi:hypothetical protein